MDATIALPSYPARPISIGRWEIASKVWWQRQEQDRWRFQPKVNGWRAIVHCPTGTMFNRHGERLTIAHEFKEALAVLKASPFTWLDCEALERRHALGQGSLIVLDWMPTGGGLLEDHLYRRSHLTHNLEEGTLLGMTEPNQVFVIPEVCLPQQLWEETKAANERLGCEFYEGIVGKKVDSLYVHQLRSADEETCSWVKSRWRF